MHFSFHKTLLNQDRKADEFSCLNNNLTTTRVRQEKPCMKFEIQNTVHNENGLRMVCALGLRRNLGGEITL